MSYAASLTPLLLDFLPLGDPVGRLLVAVVVLLIVVLVGRLVLAVAWRILMIAAVVIGVLYLLSFLGF